MDVRIGIIQTPKELEVELKDDADRDKVVADIEKLLKSGDGVLWLTDRKGRKVGVPGGQGGLHRSGGTDRRAPCRLRRTLIPRRSPGAS